MISPFAKWVCWNIFLASIPVVVAYSLPGLLSLKPRGAPRKIAIGALGVIWLAFLPNSCYLLTEWRHFFDLLESSGLYSQAQTQPGHTLQFLAYALFYFLYSGAGVLSFALSIRPVQRTLRQRYNLTVPAAIFFFMMALGVYLGLILRLNSWDIIRQPGIVFASIWGVVDRPVLLGMIAGFAAFLWLLYEAVDIWIDGFQHRISQEQKVTA